MKKRIVIAVLAFLCVTGISFLIDGVNMMTIEGVVVRYADGNGPPLADAPHFVTAPQAHLRITRPDSMVDRVLYIDLADPQTDSAAPYAITGAVCRLRVPKRDVVMLHSPEEEGHDLPLYGTRITRIRSIEEVQQSH